MPRLHKDFVISVQDNFITFKLIVKFIFISGIFTLWTFNERVALYFGCEGLPDH